METKAQEDERFRQIAEANARRRQSESETQNRVKADRDALRSQARQENLRLINESGLLTELDAYKDKARGKQEKAEYFIDHPDRSHSSVVTFVWGKAFRVRELPNGFHKIEDSGFPLQKLDANILIVEVYPETNRVAVNTPLSGVKYATARREWGDIEGGRIGQNVRDALAHAFASPGKLTHRGH